MVTFWFGVEPNNLSGLNVGVLAYANSVDVNASTIKPVIHLGGFITLRQNEIAEARGVLHFVVKDSGVGVLWLCARSLGRSGDALCPGKRAWHLNGVSRRRRFGHGFLRLRLESKSRTAELSSRSTGAHKRNVPIPRW